MLARSVGCQRYRCLRALPTSHSHQHLKDAKTLVEPGLQSSNQRQSLPQKTGRLECIPWQATRVEQNTHVASASRGRHRTPPRFNAASLNHRQCWHAGATPVRWMSEVSLPTSVAYEPFPPASEGCQDSRRTRVAKLQSASESSTEDRVMTGDDDGDDDDGQATSMACRAREDGDWMCHARRAVRTSCRRATSQHVDDHTRHEHAKMTTRCWHAGATPVR